MPHGMAWHGIAQLGIESAQSSGIAVMCAGTIHEPVGGLRQLLPGRAAAGAHPHGGEVATVIASQHHHALSVRSAYCHFGAD